MSPSLLYDREARDRFEPLDTLLAPLLLQQESNSAFTMAEQGSTIAATKHVIDPTLCEAAELAAHALRYSMEA